MIKTQSVSFLKAFKTFAQAEDWLAKTADPGVIIHLYERKGSELFAVCDQSGVDQLDEALDEARGGADERALAAPVQNRSALTLDRPMTFGGCPFCGSQSCIAGRCKLNTTPPAAQPAPVQEPDYEAMWHKVWPDVGSFVRASADDLKKFAKAVSTPPVAPVQEPVGGATVYVHQSDDKGDVLGERWKAAHVKFKDGFLDQFAQGAKFDLYTTPPAAQRQWVGLTKDQRDDFALQCGSYETVCAIEAKLKEKNT